MFDRVSAPDDMQRIVRGSAKIIRQRKRFSAKATKTAPGGIIRADQKIDPSMPIRAQRNLEAAGRHDLFLRAKLKAHLELAGSGRFKHRRFTK